MDIPGGATYAVRPNCALSMPGTLSCAALPGENEAINLTDDFRVMFGCTGEPHNLSMNLNRRVLAVDNGAHPIDVNTIAAQLRLHRPGTNRRAENKTRYYADQRHESFHLHSPLNEIQFGKD
jgi:hypothetical protein